MADGVGWGTWFNESGPTLVQARGVVGLIAKLTIRRRIRTPISVRYAYAGIRTNSASTLRAISVSRSLQVQPL